MDLQDFVTQLERILRIGITIIAAYLVALWIASVWWTFRDIRALTTDIFSGCRHVTGGGLQLPWPADLCHLAAAEDAGAAVRGLTRGRGVPTGHPGPQFLPGVQAAGGARIHLLPVVPDAPEADLRPLRPATGAALEDVPVLRRERLR